MPREPDLLRLVAVGSVDDGKSTLIGRLLHDGGGLMDDQLQATRTASSKLRREGLDLSLITDGLRAEREQGITIDVAYRHFSTSARRFIIADTPGHVQYTRNMVTGASTADLALLLVDARHGLLTQTRRHAFLASLLGIKQLVLAVNKLDAVGWDRAVFEAIRKDFTAFATGLAFTCVQCIPLSALLGDNVVSRSANLPWYDGPTLLAHLETADLASGRNLVDLRLPVQLVLRPDQDFRGLAGQLASGVLRQGDDLVALPSGWRSRVKSIVTFDGTVPYAFAPQAVTVCLEDDLDVGRGDLLVHPGNQPPLLRELQAEIVWMSESPLRPGQAYLLKHLAGTLRAVVRQLEDRVDPNTLAREIGPPMLQLNDVGRATLDLFRALPADEYAKNRATGSFVLVDVHTNETVGAGMVVARERSPSGNEVARSRHLHPEQGKVDAPARARLLGQHPATVWLTGLSAAGKSTIAYGLEQRLLQAGRACFVLDGDNLRQGLCADLGFGAGERKENVRRAAEVARLLNEAGLIAIVALISPFREERARAHKTIGEDRFLEVFVDAPLAVCCARDPKGLYRRAQANEIPEFTGISSPYEAPQVPALRLATGELSVGAAIDLVFKALEDGGFLAADLSGPDTVRCKP